MQSAARDYQLAQDAMEVLSNSDESEEETDRGAYLQPFSLPVKHTPKTQNVVKDDAGSCKEDITLPLYGKNLKNIIVKVRTTSTLDEEQKKSLENLIKSEATRLIKELETFANQKFEEKKYEQMRNDENEMKRLKKELAAVEKRLNKRKREEENEKSDEEQAAEIGDLKNGVERNAVCSASTKQRKTNSQSFRFRCNLCDYSSNRSYNYKQHMLSSKHQQNENLSNSEKSDEETVAEAMGQLKNRFRCNLCDYSSDIPYNVKRHMLVKHTPNSEWPFSCKDCGRRFTSQSELKRHKLWKHTPKSEWPYYCQPCGRHFTSQSELNRHKRSITHED